MRNHVAPLAIFEIHAYFPRWEFFPPPVTPPFKFILFLILPMVVFAHPLIVVVLKNSPILGCLYSHPSSQSVVVLCTFVYCSELFYMVGFFYLHYTLLYHSCRLLHHGSFVFNYCVYTANPHFSGSNIYTLTYSDYTPIKTNHFRYEYSFFITFLYNTCTLLS